MESLVVMIIIRTMKIWDKIVKKTYTRRQIKR